MKFQDTSIHRLKVRTHGHTDKPKAICPTNFFKVGGIIKLSICLFFPGIRRNSEGVLEDEENFDEAIQSVNTALVPTRVGS